MRLDKNTPDSETIANHPFITGKPDEEEEEARNLDEICDELPSSPSLGGGSDEESQPDVKVSDSYEEVFTASELGKYL